MYFINLSCSDGFLTTQTPNDYDGRDDVQTANEIVGYISHPRRLLPSLPPSSNHGSDNRVCDFLSMGYWVLTFFLRDLNQITPRVWQCPHHLPVMKAE